MSTLSKDLNDRLDRMEEVQVGRLGGSEPPNPPADDAAPPSVTLRSAQPLMAARVSRAV
jgi:hypothetical protein